MPRITRDKLRERIERLQKQGFDVVINWAYGLPRVTNKSESMDISPRLPNAVMNEWIDGFEMGDYRTRSKDQSRIKAIAGALGSSRNLWAS